MINTGFFLITDISGYTQFLTESELIHANEILQALFKSQLANIKQPFKVGNYQGDAIQFYAMSDDFMRPDMLLEMIETIYFEFHRHLQQADFNTTCTCTACSNMKNLDLKFFIHHGEFLLQQLGDRQELAGPDVIMVHRLMKNTVGEKYNCDGYALFTEVAIKAANLVEFAESIADHVEEYEHVGAINLKVYNLEEAWQKEQERNKLHIDHSDAWVYGSVEVPISKPLAWDRMVDAPTKKVYLGMDAIHENKLIAGRVAAEITEYHCAHETGDIYYTIIDWSPFDYFSSRDTAMGMIFFKTYRLIALDDNNTRFEILFTKPEAEEYPMPFDALKENFQHLINMAVQRFADVVAEQMDAGLIAAAG